MNESNDPRSISYVRKFIRPEIKLRYAVLYMIISNAISMLLYLALNHYYCDYAILCSVLYIAFVMLVHLKRISIWLVKAYQRYAPIEIRDKCRFEPSCSEYMIISIEKYGLKGIKKGLNRIYRCSHGDGGYDEP